MALAPLGSDLHLTLTRDSLVSPVSTAGEGTCPVQPKTQDGAEADKQVQKWSTGLKWGGITEDRGTGIGSEYN